MNPYLYQTPRGTDVVMHAYLRNQQTGDFVDLTQTGVVITARLKQGQQVFPPASQPPLQSVSVGTLPNQVRINLSSDENESLLPGVYDLQIDVSFPDANFPDNNRLERYIIPRAIHLL